MGPSSPSLTRRLCFLGGALLVEAGLGFLSAFRSGTDEIGQIAQSACAGAAGAVALMAARRRASPGLLRALPWIAFGALGALKVATYLPYWLYPAYRDFWMMLVNASWSMLGMGAPVLWGTALARRNDPGNEAARKLGRIAAGGVLLGFVLLLIYEGFSWYSMSALQNMMFDGVFAISPAIQLPDRLLLLLAAIESIRPFSDEGTVRRRASRIHRLMGCWLVLSLLANSLVQLLWYSQAYSDGGRAGPGFEPLVLRVLLFKTLTVAATLALCFHFASSFGHRLADAESTS